MRRMLALAVLRCLVWGIATAFTLGLFLEAQRTHGTTSAFWGIVALVVACVFVAETRGGWDA